MKIIIHRGANQIGGCVTEITTAKSKILIDLGSNLPCTASADYTQSEIELLCKGANGIFYTHYHGDHIGHISSVPNHIPQYIGQVSKEVLLCKYNALNSHGDYSKTIKTIERFDIYKYNETITINDGDIKITPYYVSHSACNAHMFKIEAEGQTILHTGDFRKHGYLGKGLMYTLNRCVKQVDFLIIEGTMLSRKSEAVKHEVEIKKEMKHLINTYKGKCIFVLCSSTDMDRLASFKAACKETNTPLLCDYYQKEILDIFTKHCDFGNNLFNFGYVKRCYYKSNKRFFDLFKSGFVILVRQSHIEFIRQMLKHYPDAELVYSMWRGYYAGNDKQIIPDVVDIVNSFNGRIHYLHTSGHADVETLQEVCKATRPRLGIIPIHKDPTSHFEDLEIADTFNIISSSCKINNIDIEIK